MLELGAPCPTEGCKGRIKSKSRPLEDTYLEVTGLGVGPIKRMAGDWTFTCTNGHKHGAAGPAEQRDRTGADR